MSKGRTYLYLGPELGERSDAVDALRSSLAAEGGGAPEEHSFYAGETRLGDLLSLLMNASLFSSRRLITVKNAEVIKKKDEVDLLVQYIASPAEDTVLILVSDETSVDRRLEEAVPKDAKRVFWELFEDRKTEWVASFFRREGFRLSPDAVDSILELVENNTDALRRECGRLVLFLNPSKVVEAEDVEGLLAHTREESAFTLFARIADGDLPKAVETLHTLLGAKESPVQIFAGLSWCFKRLGDYVALADAGRINDFELRRVGIASKRAQRDYAAAAKRYDAAAVARCTSLIAEFDVTLRASGAALETILMDVFLCKLVAGRGRSLERISYRTS